MVKSVPSLHNRVAQIKLRRRKKTVYQQTCEKFMVKFIRSQIAVSETT